MRIDFYGLVLDTPQVTFYLWSPWRASFVEHRLFDAIAKLPGVSVEKDNDEVRAQVDETKTFRDALRGVARVLKGWQEEGDPGRERRTWRWLWEGDCDDGGYDHTGEIAGLWGFLRLGLDRGEPGEPEKGEDIDLNGFGLKVWPQRRDL